MPNYPLELRNSFLSVGPSRQLGRSLDRMDAHDLIARRADQLAIERAVEATERGMVGIARISLKEAALYRVAPHAEARLRMAADGGSAVILGRIIEAGL
jgi:hypothetical protein